MDEEFAEYFKKHHVGQWLALLRQNRIVISLRKH
jgi:hypothetical protein